MALHVGFAHGTVIHRWCRADDSRGVVAAASKPNKGFGGVRKQEEQKLKRDGLQHDDRKAFKEAAAAVTSHRPVKLDEAAKGKLDYVQVADWGDGDRSKLGELRLVSHVRQYEGGGANRDGTGDGGGGGAARPFHMQLAHQLKMAEARGALAVAGPPPPPASAWSFREERYVQYLADQLEVHQALEAALMEATGGRPPATTDELTATGSTGTSDSSSNGPAIGQEGQPPPQGAVHALQHLVPGRLGLERSAVLLGDLAALRATADHRTAVVANVVAAAGPGPEPAPGPAVSAALSGAAADADGRPAASQEKVVQARTAASEMAAERGSNGLRPAAVPSGTYTRAAATTAQQEQCWSSSYHDCAPGPMARSYAQVLRRLGRVAATGEREQERESSARRLLAHAAVIHLVAGASGVRVGATAAERLALLQRRAAATYHQYPPQVTDPRVTLSRALDAAGEHLRSPAARQEVYDEVARAMQKTALLLSALAHRD